MKRNIFTICGVYFIVILLIVLGFFLLNIEKSPLNYWALGSLLLSLTTTLAVAIVLSLPNQGKNQVFYAAGLGSTIWIYLIIIIISILFTSAFEEHLNGFIFLQVAIHLLFVIISLIISTVSASIHKSNIKVQEKLSSGEYDKPKRGGF